MAAAPSRTTARPANSMLPGQCDSRSEESPGKKSHARWTDPAVLACCCILHFIFAQSCGASRAPRRIERRQRSWRRYSPRLLRKIPREIQVLHPQDWRAWLEGVVLIWFLALRDVLLAYAYRM
eukprot:3306254-Rhodomonas_salina.1